MNNSTAGKNRRVLVIDDNRSIHDDFRKILSPPNARAAAFDAQEAAVFGQAAAGVRQIPFAVDSAYQGEEGLRLVQEARAAGQPYAMAFVDVRMPPGWDGVETTRRIWDIDPDVQIVLCTAYSDYSWDEVFAQLGQRDGLLILKKPFDTVEALQLAHALTEKWRLSQEARQKMETLESRVAERTGELRHSNHTLQMELSAHHLARLEIERLNADLERRVAQRTEALLVATEEAQSANRAKSEFLSRTSHELRTPMNAILGFGQLLEMEENLAPEPRESIGQILQAGRHLLTLIDEVLDISDAESGNLTLSLEPVAVAPLIKETLCLAQPLAAAFHIALAPPAFPGSTWSVRADPQRLKQVLLALLSNAIQYNRPGGKVVLECASAAATVPPALRFSVRDTGPGISAAHLPRLFTPFDRLDADRTRDRGAGAGLGLTLARRMIELMGGRIGVESVLGEGSTFWVEMPLTESLVAPLAHHGSPRGGRG